MLLSPPRPSQLDADQAKILVTGFSDPVSCFLLAVALSPFLQSLTSDLSLSASLSNLSLSRWVVQGAVAASGLRMGDRKYISIGGIPGECLRGRKGAGGCTIKKTNTAMVIGIYEEGVQGGDCNVIVENLGDYLIGQNI